MHNNKFWPKKLFNFRGLLTLVILTQIMETEADFQLRKFEKVQIEVSSWKTIKVVQDIRYVKLHNLEGYYRPPPSFFPFTFHHDDND